MKAHLTVFALSAIMIASIGLAPAFGQIQTPIVVTTDKSSYLEGETILVTGEVQNLYSGTPVSLTVVAPNKNIVALGQITIGADKKFSKEITSGGVMKIEGTYIVTVQYGSENRSATTSFTFGGAMPGEDDVVVQNPGITDTTVSIEGTDDLITYEITGGRIISVIPDVSANSLIIKIDATDDGVLTITIPKSVLLSETDGVEEALFILIDAEEVDFEETTTSTGRTLVIPFQMNAEEIEIIGTWVIPEFGTIAAMILAVAIISIIAISAKSKLSIIPRY